VRHAAIEHAHFSTSVLDLVAAAASYEEVLADYPFLEREDILAAIEYAARQADHVVLASS
jgi:uncharacterized protein (DUF433 family)